MPVRYMADLDIDIWRGGGGTTVGAEPQNPQPGALWFDEAAFEVKLRYENDWLTVASPDPTAAPRITSPLTARGAVDSAFNYQITATQRPTSYAATNLPAGLTVNATSGLIDGTPTAEGSSIVELSATNGIGTGSASLALTIRAASNGGGGGGPSGPAITPIDHVDIGLSSAMPPQPQTLGQFYMQNNTNALFVSYNLAGVNNWVPAAGAT